MSMLINPFWFGSGGGGGGPSDSSIVIMGDAEIEAATGDIIAGASIATGITDAHGRVYDTFSQLKFYTYPAGQTEFVSAGMRFRPRVDSEDGLLRIRRVSGSTDHISLRRLTGGAMQVRLHGPAQDFAGAGSIMDVDTWYYAMLYARIHDTSGEFIAKIFDDSGSLIESLTQTGVDTLNSGNNAEMSAWGGATTDAYIDHLWTDINGAFRGCGRVDIISPNAAGDVTQWSRGGTDTGNNWDQVDERPKNTTSYVFSTGADEVDVYKFQARNISGPVVGVQQVTYARAHTTGTREFKAVCRIGGVTYEHADTHAVTSTSSDIALISRWQNNPATGNAWEDGDLGGASGAQFGIKSVTTDVRVQTVALQILVDITA